MQNNWVTMNSKLQISRSNRIDKSISLFNRGLNRGCLAYMFSLRFLGSKFLINSRRQFRVREIFRTQVFAGFAFFSAP